MPLDKQPVTHTFTSGIDTVTAEEYLANDKARKILNCNSLSTAVGDVGVITNVKGNTLIPNTLPSGENKTIGYAVDEESNNLYIFNCNSNKYHGIYRFNSLDKTIIPVLINLTDTSDIDILRFDPKYRILHADVVRNELLYWVDGLNPARKTNITKLLDKSSKGYGVSVREEYINAYKVAPIYSPDAEYFSDNTKQFNRLYGRLYKFIYRFIYDDGEKSNWSDMGNVALPNNEPISGITSIPSNNNGIKITVETGSPIVKQIEIAMQSTDASTTDGILNFVTIANLDKRVLGINNDSTYVYSFYNDASYTVTDMAKVIRPYSYLPKIPRCQSFVKNALTYANFYEGFPTVEISTEVTVTYNDLGIDPGTVNEFNKPVFVRTAHSVSYVGGKRPRITNETLSIGSDVKKGNVFTLNMSAGGGLSTTWTYTATAFDTSQTVANYFRNKINTWYGIVFTDSVTEVSVDSDQTASFSYTLQSTEYFDAYPSVTPIQFNSLKDTGQSLNNIKLGSSIKLGIIYEDQDGRKSLVYTNDNLVVSIDTINSLEGLKQPVITLKIKHRPPVWAKYYQIVRSNDLVYGDYIQMLVQDVTEIDASNGGEYLDLVVGSLFTYQKLHENTVLQYTFEKGDRIRLISSFNADTSEQTYYNFYESEVLSYKDTVTEVKTESAKTTENSPNVEIGGATNDDDVGKVILINGVERTIASVLNGNTYTVNRNYPSDGTYATYSIIDRRGTLRIRKPPVDVVPEVKDLSLVEIYKPSTGLSSTESKLFNEFDQKFDILNWGTETRSHAGASQNQDGTNDTTLSTTPAIIIINNGTAYVRNRELPITNNIPGAQVLIGAIEDSGFSDFYNSTFNNNGRVTVEDTGDGEVHFGSRVRFSNNFIEDTRINGLNDFNNADREDYNDQYGDIMRTFFDQNRLYAFKSLKDTWIPVGQSILSQADGTPVVGLSNKLLGNMQYFGYEGGIGNNPESLAYNASWIYHVMPNAGVVVRIGGDGITPISEIYEVDNEIRNRIKDAVKNGVAILGGFDRESGVFVLSIGEYRVKIYDDQFIEGLWTLVDEELTDATFEIVYAPLNGTAEFTNGTQITYTPNEGYVGNDTIVYRAIVNGVPRQPTNICITVTPLVEQKAWRQKESSYYCVLEDGVGTGYKGWATLEQYGISTSTPTGEEKPNVESDADYVAPVYDPESCNPNPDQFTFTDLTDKEISTQYESNTITVTGNTTPSPISVTGGEYSVNGGAYTSVDGVVNAGATVKMRITSSASYVTAKSGTLNIGDKSDTFTVTTKVEPVIFVSQPSGSISREITFTPEFASPFFVYAGFALNYPVTNMMSGIVQTQLAEDVAGGRILTVPQTGNYRFQFSYGGQAIYSRNDDPDSTPYPGYPTYITPKLVVHGGSSYDMGPTVGMSTEGTPTRTVAINFSFDQTVSLVAGQRVEAFFYITASSWPYDDPYTQGITFQAFRPLVSIEKV